MGNLITQRSVVQIPQQPFLTIPCNGDHLPAKPCEVVAKDSAAHCRVYWMSSCRSPSLVLSSPLMPASIVQERMGDPEPVMLALPLPSAVQLPTWTPATFSDSVLTSMFCPFAGCGHTVTLTVCGVVPCS